MPARVHTHLKRTGKERSCRQDPWALAKPNPFRGVTEKCRTFPVEGRPV